MDIKQLKKNWENIDSKQWKKIPSSIYVGNILPFQLSNAIKMPVDSDFKVGSLSLALEQLRITSKKNFFPKVKNIKQKNQIISVSIELPPSTLTGSNKLTGKQIWHPTIDAMKDSIKTDSMGRVQLFISTTENKNPAWIASAKAQQNKLLAMGENGETLVGNYSDNREALNEAFVNPLCYAFQSEWACDSITAMASHTNDCMSNNTKQINDNTIYSNGSTYNENALIQQGSLLSNLQGLGTTLPNGKPDPNCQYNQAVTAILSFRGNMLLNTGSTKIDSVPSQTTEGVYSIVKNGKPTSQLSMEDAFSLLSGKEVQLRNHQGKFVKTKLHDKEIEVINNHNKKFSDHAIKLASAKPIVLSHGPLIANISEFQLNLNFTLIDNKLSLEQAGILLPEFSYQLDESAWPKEISALVREEMEKALFIKKLVYDRVLRGLNESISPVIVSILEGVSG